MQLLEPMHIESLNSPAAGSEMYELISELFPICRSNTGEGVRETLRILQQRIPLAIHEVLSGTRVFDWEVPQEWNIHDAYIKDASGKRIVDFRQSNLHVVNGSMPIQARLTWSELKPHLTTLPEHLDWIPYRTCFFEKRWGFCLSHARFLELEQQGEAEYEVCIDSRLEDGSLTYGELLLRGEVDEEVLISTHVCHPSLANDNLSGIAVATQLACHLEKLDRRLSYRFLFIPATIGAVTWLCLNESELGNIKHGMILSVVGDSGASTYRRTRHGDAEIDRAVEHVLKHSDDKSTLLDFEPFGYDQRQFCSPGINLPVGCLMRTPDQQYPEYHTSADNLDFVRPECLADSWAKCVRVTDVLEHNRTYLNCKPKCEPRLGPSGLYHAFDGVADWAALQRATLWVLNLSDGEHSLLEIAERSELSFSFIKQGAALLKEHGFLTELKADAANCPLPATSELSATC